MAASQRDSSLAILSRFASRRPWLCLLLVASLLLMPGCGGCGGQQTTKPKTAKQKLAAKKKKKKKPKDPFEITSVYSLPSDMERMGLYFKPGHWTEFTTEVRANQNDFLGNLVTDPLKLEGMPYRLGSSRPAVLPKGVNKYLGMVVYAPSSGGARQVHIRLTPRGSSRGLKEQLQRSFRMKSWCFNFLVLSANPDDYLQLLGHRKLDSLRPSSEGFNNVLFHPYYHVRIPKLDRYVPVSENSLTWTSTAYILWDGISPSLLSDEQKRALVDWVHWGGQLIISGPDSLEQLKDDPLLGPLLPAVAEKDIQLHNDDLATFSKNWTNQEFMPRPINTFEDEFDEKAFDNGVLPGVPPGILPPGFNPGAKTGPPRRPGMNRPGQVRKITKARPLRVAEKKPWSAKKLIVQPGDPNVEVLAAADAKMDGTPGVPLVVDRRVGRGRIVLTAFRLTQQELRLTNWPSFDAFFNGCLLRRPPRAFYAPNEAFELWVDWKHAKNNRLARFDAALVSRVRYYSRDSQLKSPQIREAFAELEKVKWEEAGGTSDRPSDVEKFPELGFGIGVDPTMGDERRQPSQFGPGVAGWSDFNHVAQLARHTLGEAAGIVIPKADFVVYILGVYLIVLVPLNFIVFWLMGRVEWAWIAAPVITIVCAVAVVKLAELDIGFARSRSELAIIEIQGDYKRAHVTRYSGLYTSLATSYDLRFDDPAALVQPFPTYSKAEIEKRNIYQGDTSDVHYRREDNVVTLAGFNVSSNSTGMLHSEHMLDVGGGLKLAKWDDAEGTGEIINRSNLDLNGAAVVTRQGVAWIGGFDSGVKKSFQLGPRPRGDLNYWFQEREKAEITARPRRDDLLKARLLLRMAESVDTMEPGEIRLVAWTNKELPGMQITPAASQARYANVIVAHLKYEPLPHGRKNEDDSSREAFEYKPERKYPKTKKGKTEDEKSKEDPKTTEDAAPSRLPGQ